MFPDRDSSDELLKRLAKDAIHTKAVAFMTQLPELLARHEKIKQDEYFGEMLFSKRVASIRVYLEDLQLKGILPEELVDVSDSVPAPPPAPIPVPVAPKPKKRQPKKAKKKQEKPQELDRKRRPFTILELWVRDKSNQPPYSESPHYQSLLAAAEDFPGMEGRSQRDKLRAVAGAVKYLRRRGIDIARCRERDLSRLPVKGSPLNQLEKLVLEGSDRFLTYQDYITQIARNVEGIPGTTIGSKRSAIRHAIDSLREKGYHIPDRIERLKNRHGRTNCRPQIVQFLNDAIASGDPLVWDITLHVQIAERFNVDPTTVARTIRDAVKQENLPDCTYQGRLRYRSKMAADLFAQAREKWLESSDWEMLAPIHGQALTWLQGVLTPGEHRLLSLALAGGASHKIDDLSRDIKSYPYRVVEKFYKFSRFVKLSMVFSLPDSMEDMQLTFYPT